MLFLCQLWKDWEIKGKRSEKSEDKVKRPVSENLINELKLIFILIKNFSIFIVHFIHKCHVSCYVLENTGLGLISEIYQHNIWQCQVRIKVWFLIYNGVVSIVIHYCLLHGFCSESFDRCIFTNTTKTIFNCL